MDNCIKPPYNNITWHHFQNGFIPNTPKIVDLSTTQVVSLNVKLSYHKKDIKQRINEFDENIPYGSKFVIFINGF